MAPMVRENGLGYRNDVLGLSKTCSGSNLLVLQIMRKSIVEPRICYEEFYAISIRNQYLLQVLAAQGANDMSDGPTAILTYLSSNFIAFSRSPAGSLESKVKYCCNHCFCVIGTLGSAAAQVVKCFI